MLLRYTRKKKLKKEKRLRRTHGGENSSAGVSIPARSSCQGIQGFSDHLVGEGVPQVCQGLLWEAGRTPLSMFGQLVSRDKEIKG